MTAPDPITRAVRRPLCTGCAAGAGLVPEAIRRGAPPVHGRRPVAAATPEGWHGLRPAHRRDPSGAETVGPGNPHARRRGPIRQAGRRWRCRICTQHTGAVADSAAGHPRHEAPGGEARAGRSQIVARTPRGLRLLGGAAAARGLWRAVAVEP
jgi:coenzyme F420 hydrogenase subunit beta